MKTKPTNKLQAICIKEQFDRVVCRMPCALRPAPCSLHPACPARGFTLLEILIAIFIFSVLVTTIFGSFNTVFGNIGAIEDHMDTYEMAQSCFNRIITDLQSLHVAQPPAYAAPQDEAAADPYRFIGDITYAGNTGCSRLRFTSLAHVPLGKQKRSGIAEIIYYVETESDGTLVLRRSDILDPAAETPEKIIKDPILCEKVLVFAMTFLNWDGEAQETWDSDSEDFDYATPRAVHIRIVTGTADIPHPFETTVVLPQVRRKVTSEG
jgi:general secretion pathway protein J